MISIYDTNELEKFRSKNAIQPHQIKLILRALFKNAKSETEALENIDQSTKQIAEKKIIFTSLELIEKHDSKIDGASKLIFKTADNHLIESVILRPQTGRTSICISSQIGCACNCQFCATGKMGFTRNLSLAEILDQVAIANRILKSEDRSIRNVVFMGMGEPLLNRENVFRAIELLKDPQYFNLASSRLMVSTVGIPDGIEAFTEKFPDVSLALSLHSARQEVREKLMPVGKTFTLEILKKALKKNASKNKVMFEYLMLKDINDKPEDLLALKNYLSDLNAHINLIPFNSHENCQWIGTEESERRAFADDLKSAGFECTLRYSLGADIAAACGQLVQQKTEAQK